MMAIEKLNYRKIIRYLWVLMAFFTLVHYIIFPEKYTAEFLLEFFQSNSTAVFITYVVLSVIRSVFFLPSTIFVVMGVVLYPDEPFLVLTVSMLGILLGATWIYLAAGFLKVEALFSANTQKKFQKAEIGMNKYGFWIVLFWSFFPAVPTDLICYVAGYSKMSYLKFITALFVGELVLVSLYIWTGKSLIEILF